MRKQTIDYHLEGHRKLCAALGKYSGDPYDEAVKRLTKAEKPAEPKAAPAPKPDAESEPKKAAAKPKAKAKKTGANK